MGYRPRFNEIKSQQVGVLFTRAEGYGAYFINLLAFMSPPQVKFRKKAGRKLYVSFIENKIYIAIEYEEDLFEPKLFQSMLNFSPIREYFENLQLMISIVQDLNLNRRIWSRN